MFISKSLQRLLIFLVWIIVSSLALILGYFSIWVFMSSVDGKVGPISEAAFIFLSFGVFLPLAQWFIIRKFLPKSHEWLIASVIGVLISAGIGFGIFSLTIDASQEIGNVGKATLFGAMIGVAQWAYLRQHTHNAAWWILSSALGWGIMSLSTGMIVDGFLELVMFGLTPVTFTGVAIVYLLPTGAKKGKGEIESTV